MSASGSGSPRASPSSRTRRSAKSRARPPLSRPAPLHRDRPDQDIAREAIGEAVEDVADDGAGRRGDDADDRGEEGQLALALLGEQPFGGKTLLAVLEQLEQRAHPGELHRLE